MIIITSVGRAGTSFLAEYCKQVGLNIGQVNWVEEYRAGNECKDTVRINNILKNRILKKEKLLDEMILNQIKELKNDIVKDPQFLIYPQIINVWLKARIDLKVIFLTREHQQIVDSLRKVPTMNSPVFRNHTDLILEHEIDFKKTCNSLDLELIEFKYPDFLSSFKEVNLVLESFSNKELKNEKLWNRLVSQRPLR